MFLYSLKVDKKQMCRATSHRSDSPVLTDIISIIMEMLSVKFHHAELSLLSSADVDFIIDSVLLNF